MIPILTEAELDWLNTHRAMKRIEQTLALGPVAPASVPELMARFRSLLGDADMDRDAGKWRNRVNQWPRRTEALLMNLEARVAGGAPIREPARYAESMWRKYAAPNLGKTEK